MTTSIRGPVAISVQEITGEWVAEALGLPVVKVLEVTPTASGQPFGALHVTADGS